MPLSIIQGWTSAQVVGSSTCRQICIWNRWSSISSKIKNNTKHSQSRQSCGQDCPHSWSVQDCRLVTFSVFKKHRPFDRQSSSWEQHELCSAIGSQGMLDPSISPLGKKHSADLLTEKIWMKYISIKKYRLQRHAVKYLMIDFAMLAKSSPE